MSSADVIRFRSQPYTVQRPAAPTVTDGYAIPNTPTTLTITAHVQPLNTKELRNLLPGQNGSDWRNIWSLDLIRLRDRILIEGRYYTLQSEATWTQGSFWHAQVVYVLDTLP